MPLSFETGCVGSWRDLDMSGSIGFPVASGGNGAKAFQCFGCYALVSTSDRLLPIGGKSRHQFVNPAGIRCDFLSFASTPGAVARGGATDEASWFPGYRWRLAFCRRCGRHLGWRYEAVAGETRPLEFWGILIAYLLVR